MGAILCDCPKEGTMKKTKQKKSNGITKTKRIVFSKKKADLLKDLLLKVIIKETIS